MSWAPILFNHPTNNILKVPIGRVGLGLLDIGLGRVGSRNLDPCTSLH